MRELPAAEAEVLGLVLEQTHRFASRTIDAAAIEQAGEIGSALLEQLAELGLFGLTIPEEHGGMGLSLGAASKVVAELARFDRSVAVSVGLHCGLGTRGLVELASPELQAEWLPRLATGEVIAAFAATEAEAGSDLGGIRTTGVVEGDELVVSGEKIYVTNGGFAGVFTVLARTPGLGGARAHSVLCIPRSAEGVNIGREEHKLGIRGSSTVTVEFDSVRLPLANVIGTPGQGMPHAHRILEWGRTLMSAGCMGTARAALEATVAHVQIRRQFKRPIVKFEATRAHLAAMAADHFAMEALVDRVGAIERGGDSIATASAIAKVFCSEGAFDVCDRAIQLHGALGYIEETGIARMLRDCRVTRIFEGANDVLLVHIGTALLGAAEGETPSANPDLPVELADAHSRWAAAHGQLIEAAADVRKRLGVSAVTHQLVLQRLARAHVALTAASASMDRAAGSTRRDMLLSSAAVERLVPRAEHCLSTLRAADEDAARDQLLSDVLCDSAEEATPRERKSQRQEVAP